MSGFGFLALAVTFSSGVAMTMKAANAKKISFWHFLAVNYLVCSLGLLAWGAWRDAGQQNALIWALGGFTGFMYVLCLWLFDRAISATGLALSTTLMRLSAALPTLGSLILFAEPATASRLLGLLLAFCCLPLASAEPLSFDKKGRATWQGMIWGLLLFGAYGATDFVFKIQAEMAPMADPKTFMAIIFGTALLFTAPRFIRGADALKNCFGWGVALGTTNLLATYCMIRALARIPGSVAFPTLGLGVIAVTTLASLVVWHERLRPANVVFLILASLAVVLINI